MSTLHGASRAGDTKLVKQLLDQGVPVDEKDKEGNTALMKAILHGQTEVVKLLIDKGALFDAVDARGDSALLVLAGVDEDHLGRMAAFQVHRHLLQRSDVLASHTLATPETTPEARSGATGMAVLNLVRLAGSAAGRARKLRSSDPRSADGHQALFARLQLAAAACVQNDESGTARGDKEVQKLFRSKDGHKALEYAVQIEAKELLAQPVVQAYVMVAWRGPLDMDDLEAAWAQWLAVVIVLLLNLLFLLPLVVLVPALESWLTKSMDTGDGMNFYLLRLPAVKFGLECAADLALALALTVTPAADLATAPLAPLLLFWVASGLLREGGQVKGQASSSAIASLRARRLAHVREQFATIWIERARSCRAGGKICYAASLVALRWLACLLDRLTAYWADHINRVDATALVFSFAALVASLFRADDDEHATTVTRLAGGGGSALAGTATSLRAVAVLLLWFRLFRVLLISPRFGPFVRMFFRMLFGDLLNFLVLLFFLLVAFAASWTVLLAPHPSLVAQQFSGDEQVWRWTISPVAYLETAGCANELGGVDFFSTLQTLLEGALTGNDFFACARDSTKSPWAAWAISFMFVTLTTVLLLNMLIAMCAAKNKEQNPEKPLPHLTLPWTLTYHTARALRATAHVYRMAKTFDNISEAAATNYLFLFAQRTLALQNEPPTPSPLNALGLPCKGILLLWGLLCKKDKTPAPNETTPGAAAETLRASADEASTWRSTSSPSSSPSSVDQGTRGEETPRIEDSEETFTIKIAPLAREITEYILDHQDDAAQEDRWRTTMKRAMGKSFREQHKEVQAVKAALMHKVETEIQSMQLRFDEIAALISKQQSSEFRV